MSESKNKVMFHIEAFINLDEIHNYHCEVKADSVSFAGRASQKSTKIIDYIINKQKLFSAANIVKISIILSNENGEVLVEDNAELRLSGAIEGREVISSWMRLATEVAINFEAKMESM